MKYCVAILSVAMLLQGCIQGPESAHGFRLPDGSPDMGMQAIRDLRCQGCHDIPGVEAPAEIEIETRVPLGGQVSRVKTYGELVTAIINPSHDLAPGYREEAVTRDGRSLMEDANLNDIMTVQELVDIVAYLQPHYRVKPPEYNPYSYIYR